MTRPATITAHRITLEICVDTPQGLLAAIKGGAQRIELCSALSEGGLSPSLGFMNMASTVSVPVRAMIRPRSGDFTYSSDDIGVMRKDILAAASAKLEGVVLGANLASGALDEDALIDLVKSARALGLKVALHRSFDIAPEPHAALDLAISLGIDTVLTSGGSKTADAGLSGLRALVKQAQGRIEILAGSGVTPQNAALILETGVTALHASCRNIRPFLPGRATDLGYVTPDLRDTDGALVAAFRNHLTHLELSHVIR